MPKVVEAKPLAHFQFDSRFDGCWPEITLRQHASDPWRLTLRSSAREDPITVLGVSRLLFPAEHELSQNGHRGTGAFEALLLGSPSLLPTQARRTSIRLRSNETSAHCNPSASLIRRPVAATSSVSVRSGSGKSIRTAKAC